MGEHEPPTHAENPEPGEPHSPMDAMLEMHRDNQSRFQALEDRILSMTGALATIAANTACLPTLVHRVGTLEKVRAEQDGRIKGIQDSIKLLWVVAVPPVGGLLAWLGTRINWGSILR